MGLYNFYKILKDIFRTLFGKHFLKVLLVSILLFLGYIIFSADKVEAATSYSFNSTSDQFYCNTTIPEAVYNTLTTISYYNDSNYHCLLYAHVYPYRAMFTTDNISVTLNNRLNINGSHFFYWYNINAQGQITSSGSQSWYNYYDDLWADIYTKQIYRNINVVDDYSRLSSDYIWAYNINPYHPTTPPFIDTSTQDIQNWSFTTFDINMGTYERNSTYKYVLDYSYNGVSRYMDVTNYFFDDYNIKIPVEDFAPGIVLRNSSTLSFGLLAIYSVDGVENTLNYFTIDDNSYTLSLTAEQEEQLYQDRSTQTSTNIFVNTENINNSLTSSDYDKSDIDNILSFDTGLSGLDVVSALQNMFHTVELAFVSNEPIDIVFTVPFTDAQFVIPYNYTEEHIPLSGRLMLQVIWLGLVSLWCFKRVMTIVDFVEER